MRKAIIIIVLALASVALLGHLSKDALNKQLIQLEDGRIMAVDRYWLIGERVFCETEYGFQVFDRSLLKGRTKGMPGDMEQLRMRLAYLTGGWFQWKMDLRQKLAYAHGVLTVVLGLLALWGLRLLLRSQKRWRLATAQRPRTTSRLKPDPTPGRSPSLRLAGLSDVENHFLEIFRYQLGADPQARAVVELIQPNFGKRGGQYRLAVLQDDEWRERRMTITPLGESASSKSQCFYVIYDTHLVVKIPPLRISDFSDYRQRLRQEALVVRQLGQRPCIIPNLAALLARVHPIGTQENEVDLLETLYHQWLQTDTSRQRFLKIAGAFAFFMDVSRYQFLSDVMAQLGDATGRWDEVISEDVELVDFPQRFEEKYGEVNGPLGFQIQSLFTAFDQELRRQTVYPKSGSAVTETQKKEWMLTRLAGLPLPADHTPSAALAAAADRLLQDLTGQDKSLSKGYRHLAGAEAQKRTFRQAKPRMSALVTNMLDLLAWLGHRRLAMRDLKPDNLFVAGDPKQYPHFLSSPDRFDIGLIDVETAVICPAGTPERCSQPQMGGTPPYSTPSHFFPNSLLQAVGGDLWRILHFQDWYAVLAIVFEIVAGRRLFTRTGRLIPRMILAIRQKGCRGEAAENLFRNFSRKFWAVAKTEFDRRVEKTAVRLESVWVDLPDSLSDELKVHLEKSQTALSRQIETIIDGQDPKIEPARRKMLIYDDLDGLRRMMADCTDRRNPDTERFLNLCFALVPLKQSWEEGERVLEALSQKPACVTVKALLPLMFGAIQNVMCPFDAAAPGEAPDPLEAWRVDGRDGEILGFTHSLGFSVSD